MNPNGRSRRSANRVRGINGRDIRGYRAWNNEEIGDINAGKITHEQILRSRNVHRMLQEQVYVELLRRFPDENELADNFQPLVDQEPEENRPLKRSVMGRKKGDKAFAAGHYEQAKNFYVKAMREILGPDFQLPATLYLESQYIRALRIEENVDICIDIVDLCNKVALCYSSMGKKLESLNWLHEVEKIYSCQESIRLPGHLPWVSRYMFPLVLEYSTFRMETCLYFTELFKNLQNTAAAAYYAFYGHSIIPSLYVHGIHDIEALREKFKYMDTAVWRHPPLESIVKWDVTEPELQVRGTWTQLPSMDGEQPSARYACGCFIWKSKLYVFGGIRAGWRKLYDFWCYDLVKMNGWKRLPDFPSGFLQSSPTRKVYLMGIQMKVYKNRAYMFAGLKDIFFYDLEKNAWGLIVTQYLGHDQKRWPYGAFMLQEYCMEIFENKIYIFGGEGGRSGLGTNTLMMCDIETKQWYYLDGNTDVKADMVRPQFRRGASSWLVPKQRRVYILYGNGCRQAAPVNSEHYSEHDWIYEDMWSYHIDNRKWRRESIKGNFPTPRGRMAHVYNEKLNKAIIFGGCSDGVPTFDKNNITVPFEYSLFGDTYILDVDTQVWKHVLTREFPIYRMSAQCVVDDRTGKTYLFGGFNTSNFVPSTRSSPNHVYGDIWRLDIDMPGGNFDKKNFYKNMECLRIGPWMRCYGCGEINIGYMKCAGACNGKAFFCSKFCQKQSWLKHKKEHHCYKGDVTQQDSAENEAMPDAVAEEPLCNDTDTNSDGGMSIVRSLARFSLEDERGPEEDLSDLPGASHLPRKEQLILVDAERENVLERPREAFGPAKRDITRKKKRDQ